MYVSTKSFVYMIRNIVNGKCYYGSTQNGHSRLAGHRAALRRGDHYNSLLQQEWLEFGEVAFTFEIIDVVPGVHEARSAENKLIARYNTTDSQFGYNVMLRGSWSTAARLRNTEMKLIAKRKYVLLTGVSLNDQMAAVFVRSAKKGQVSSSMLIPCARSAAMSVSSLSSSSALSCFAMSARLPFVMPFFALANEAYFAHSSSVMLSTMASNNGPILTPFLTQMSSTFALLASGFV